MAEEQDVDLVEISPTAKPPVCKLMDFGKYKYEQSKNATKPRKSKSKSKSKEIKFRPGTDDGDYNIKMRKVREIFNRWRQSQNYLAFSWARNGAPNKSAHSFWSAWKPMWQKKRKLNLSPSWKVAKWWWCLHPRKNNRIISRFPDTRRVRKMFFLAA